MKRLICLAAAALLSLAGAAGALPAPERLLPAETLGFISVPDSSIARTNFKRSPLGLFLADPAMKPFTENLVANFRREKLEPLEKQLGIKLTNYYDLARGQITIALTRGSWDGTPGKKPAFVWLVDTGDKAPQARTNLAELRKSWIDKGNKMRVDKVRDVEFTTFIIPADTTAPVPGTGDAEPKSKGPKELLIGQSGSLLVASDSPKDVEKVLALQAGSSVPALADQASFTASTALARDAAVFFWLDVKTVVSTIAKGARAERPQQQGSLFAPPSMDKVLGALGIAEVQTIGGNLQSTRDGTLTHVSINVPEAGRRGILKILAVDQKDASPPPFVPADAIKFNRWRIDLQKAWTTIETTLNEISPAYGGVFKLLLDTAGKDQDPNFDLRKALLANLGDDVLSYEKAPRAGGDPANPPTLTLIGSKNAEQLAGSLKALTSIMPPEVAKYQEREFLGRKVYSFSWPALMQPGAAATPLSYTASGGYVAISTDPALVEEYLRSNEGKQKPLRETPGLNEAAQRAGGMSSGFFAYENQHEGMRATFQAAKKDPSVLLSVPSVGKVTSPLTQQPSNASATNLFEANLLPPYDKVAKYFHMAVSAVNVSPSAISFKMFTPTPPALRQ